ncbi:hypothetical protein OG693_39760 (plasmid) [Streptomyces sp. NBC_01259]|uniref:hypothetical protein n=1 Tax=Streptomyces sp. NBC_01259 TaxID=2903800 RepID=UPI003247E137
MDTAHIPAQRTATAQQRYDAAALLRDVLAAAARHGVTADDFARTVDLSAVCLDVIQAPAART